MVMYVRLQQPNVVPSSSRPWSNFRTVANIPPRHGLGARRDEGPRRGGEGEEAEVELHFWFWPVRVKDQRPRWGSLSSGIIRRDRLLVGWAPDGPVSAARLLSMVAVHPWLLFTYYRSAVVREIREEAASRQMAV